jgi:hypothetical protein
VHTTATRALGHNGDMSNGEAHRGVTSRGVMYQGVTGRAVTHQGVTGGSASTEEAAAIAAALERFMRATAARATTTLAAADPWPQAALLDGVSGGERHDVRDPWINP